MVVTKQLIPIPMYIVYVELKGSIRLRLTLTTDFTLQKTSILMRLKCIVHQYLMVDACNPILPKVYFKYSTMHYRLRNLQVLFLAGHQILQEELFVETGLLQGVKTFLTSLLLSISYPTACRKSYNLTQELGILQLE